MQGRRQEFSQEGENQENIIYIMCVCVCHCHIYGINLQMNHEEEQAILNYLFITYDYITFIRLQFTIFLRQDKIN